MGSSDREPAAKKAEVTSSLSRSSGGKKLFSAEGSSSKDLVETKWLSQVLDKLELTSMHRLYQVCREAAQAREEAEVTSLPAGRQGVYREVARAKIESRQAASASVVGEQTPTTA